MFNELSWCVGGHTSPAYSVLCKEWRILVPCPPFCTYLIDTLLDRLNADGRGGCLALPVCVGPEKSSAIHLPSYMHTSGYADDHVSVVLCDTCKLGLMFVFSILHGMFTQATCPKAVLCSSARPIRLLQMWPSVGSVATFPSPSSRRKSVWPLALLRHVSHETPPCWATPCWAKNMVACGIQGLATACSQNIQPPLVYFVPRLIPIALWLRICAAGFNWHCACIPVHGKVLCSWAMSYWMLGLTLQLPLRPVIIPRDITCPALAGPGHVHSVHCILRFVLSPAAYQRLPSTTHTTAVHERFEMSRITEGSGVGGKPMCRTITCRITVTLSPDIRTFRVLM